MKPTEQVRVKLRNGGTAIVSPAPKTHWCWYQNPPFCVIGKIGDKASMWQQNGMWAMRGQHDFDIISLPENFFV